MTAAQVAETQAKVDFEQVRKMLFPDPTTAGSIGASEQHLSQQVLKQPVQQSQEQLTDNAASLGGDTVVSGISFTTVDCDAHNRAAEMIWQMRVAVVYV